MFNEFIESNLSSETGKTGFVVPVSNRARPMMLGRLSLMLLRAEFRDIYNHKITVVRNFSGLPVMKAKKADYAKPEGIVDRQLYCLYGEFERLSASRDTKN